METDLNKNRLSELQQDLEELEHFFHQSTRPQVKQLLQEEVAKRRTQIKRIHDQAASATTTRNQTTGVVKIINYAWDQSDNFVKLFVTLHGVQNLPSVSIKLVFTTKSVDLLVSGLNNKNYNLKITNLHSAIDPTKSYHKVKQDMVVIFLKKQTSKNWASVSALDHKTDMGLPSKFDDNADPSASLMTLMKKMYDDGDDEMKRSIAKAWYDAREKQTDNILP